MRAETVNWRVVASGKGGRRLYRHAVLQVGDHVLLPSWLDVSAHVVEMRAGKVDL